MEDVRDLREILVRPIDRVIRCSKFSKHFRHLADESFNLGIGSYVRCGSVPRSISKLRLIFDSQPFNSLY